MEEKRFNILVIDNDEDTLEIFKINFKENKHLSNIHLVTCNNQSEALLLIKQKVYDLIIIDYQLIGSTGLEIGKEIREISEAPIMLITACCVMELRNIHKKEISIFDIVIQKPIPWFMLEEKMKEQLINW